jgi:hypothetical protein
MKLSSDKGGGLAKPSQFYGVSESVRHEIAIDEN